VSDDLNDHGKVQEIDTSENKPSEDLSSEKNEEVVDYKALYKEEQLVSAKKEELLSRNQQKLRKMDKSRREAMDREAQMNLRVSQFNSGELDEIKQVVVEDYSSDYEAMFGFEGAPPEDFLQVAEEFGASKQDIAGYRKNWKTVNPAELADVQDETLRRRNVSVENDKDKLILELQAKLKEDKEVKQQVQAPIIPDAMLTEVSGESDKSNAETSWDTVEIREQNRDSVSLIQGMSDADLASHISDMDS